MEQKIQNLIELVQSYPEAPYILGALALVFAISFSVVLREFIAWFFKTSKLQNQNYQLQEELKEIRRTLNQLTEKLGVEQTRIPSSSYKSSFMTKSSGLGASPAKPQFVTPEKTNPGLDPEVVYPSSQRPDVKVENKIFARSKGFPLSH